MNRHLRVLSSDDDEGIRALLFSLLTEHGHEVEFAKNSDEVFKNLGRAKYDLLILDVNTPGINGYKVAEKISGNIINRPKILIFTARNTKEEEFQFVTCGADAIIRKGESCAKIISVINELFGPQQDDSAPEAAGQENGSVTDIMNENNIRPEKSARTLERDANIKYCLSKLVQIEDLVNLKNLRYEEFIRDLLKEKQRTEKNYLEFKRIEEEVVNMKNWGYAVTAVAALAVIRSFF